MSEAQWMQHAGSFLLIRTSAGVIFHSMPEGTRSLWAKTKRSRHVSLSFSDVSNLKKSHPNNHSFLPRKWWIYWYVQLKAEVKPCFSRAGLTGIRQRIKIQTISPQVSSCLFMPKLMLWHRGGTEPERSPWRYKLSPSSCTGPGLEPVNNRRETPALKTKTTLSWASVFKLT